MDTPTFVRFVTNLARGKNEWYLSIVEDKNTLAAAGFNPHQKIVSIGYCDVSIEEFGRFADYVFQGGFFGWGSDKPVDWRPDFVVEARETVRKHLQRRKKESAYLRDSQQKELPRLEDVLRKLNS